MARRGPKEREELVYEPFLLQAHGTLLLLLRILHCITPLPFAALHDEPSLFLSLLHCMLPLDAFLAMLLFSLLSHA